MLKVVLLVIGVLVALIGTIMVFDERSLTKKLFGFGDQNEASNGLKILGFILTLVGGLIMYFNM